MKIGVLGGIGPEATGIFYLKLISRIQEIGIKSNTEFPQIFINSIPAPELVFSTVNKSDLEPYYNGLKELDSLGLDLIVMACNTIHLYYAELAASISTPLTDLRAEVRQRLGNGKVAVIGTPSTISLGLYEFPHVEYFNSDKQEQENLSDAIFKFNRGENKDEQIRKAMKVVNSKLRQGAKTILLACTEFSVMLASEDIPRLDTMDVLVDAVAKKIYKNQKIPNKK